MIDRMSRSIFAVLSLAVLACAGAGTQASPVSQASSAPAPQLQGERHLRNIRQLTFGGENAEAYFSFDGTRLIFQSTRDGAACDQQYTMNIDGSGLRRVSNGEGRTTCGYFSPDGREVFYASTHAAGTSRSKQPAQCR